MIEPEPLQIIDRTFVRCGRRTLSSFSGCDYFRLSSHPTVFNAIENGLHQFGLSVSASRTTTGNHEVYRRLEAQLANFFDAESALVVSTGYAASQIVAQTLAGAFSHALIDERAHAALQDAALLLNCPVIRFKHRDPENLSSQLNRICPASHPLVLTDGMFAYDGAIAPLKQYLKILPRDGRILVDDAHGAGVVGKTGRGALEVEGVGHSRVIQCLTLSKAFGSYGGAVLGPRSLRNAIFEHSRMFIGSTPIPLPLAYAALISVKYLQKNRAFRTRLNRNTARVKSALRNAGLTLPETSSPIIPIFLKTRRDVLALKKKLLANGIYPPLLHYPGSPANGYFRFVISSEHTGEQLDTLIAVLISDFQQRAAESL